jgi:hypothetical protein
VTGLTLLRDLRDYQNFRRLRFRERADEIMPVLSIDGGGIRGGSLAGIVCHEPRLVSLGFAKLDDALTATPGRCDERSSR